MLSCMATCDNDDQKEPVAFRPERTERNSFRIDFGLAEDSMLTDVYPPDHRIDDFLRVSRYHAAQMGMTSDDIEDCAMEFAEHMLFNQERRGKELPSAECSSAWLHRCARNHAIDYRRSLLRRCSRQVSWSGSDGSDVVGDLPDTAAGPDDVVLYREFWEIVQSGFEQIGDTAQDLFVQRYVHNRRLRDLAICADRSEQAIEQALRRIRRRIRVLLERQGVLEANLRAYLVACTATGGPALRRSTRVADD